MIGRAPPTMPVSFREYAAGDEDAAVALWLRSWQAAYPEIDFENRLDWWRRRWRDDILPAAQIVIAEAEAAGGTIMIGFVTVDPRTGYLDQIVVDPQRWGLGIGAALIAQAKRISPTAITLDVNTDNLRAIAFYKRCGFVISGVGTNPMSGRPVHRMSWQP
jgi:putative acetyltransferase